MTTDIKVEQQTKHRLTCPDCGHPVYRSHRSAAQRFMSLIRPVRHYRCRSCGWHGVIAVRQGRHRSGRLLPHLGHRLRRRLMLLAVVVVLALAAAFIAHMLSSSMAAPAAG